ncbi:Hypothetical predicted protein, partial [Pelobates cultripes]
MLNIQCILQRGLEATFITQELYDFLLQKNPRTPVIYTLPKIHKDPISPPGRPIVSAIGGALEPIAKWLDHLFKQPVEELPTCIKDTPSLLKSLQQFTGLEPDITFITCDVKSLYTIIPHDMGINAMRRILASSTSYTGPPIEYIMELLHLVLSQNYFRFEQTRYKQIAGTSMGAAMAPMYANSYMYIFEQEQILIPFHDSILFYRRFIDDIFIIWKNVGPTPDEMLNTINSLDTPVRLTMTTSDKQIDFLDVRLYREDDKIAYTLFSKPTDRNTLLHAKSHHPKHHIRSLPQSQFMRVIRNNSNIINTQLQLQIMWDKFLSRGYHSRDLTKALDRCYEVPVHNTAKNDRLVFPITYTTISDDIKR